MKEKKQIELLKFLQERVEKNQSTLTLDGLTKPQVDQLRAWKKSGHIDIYPTSSGRIPNKQLVVYHIDILPDALALIEEHQKKPKVVENPDREL